jgi:hypothetical protein
MVRSPCGLKDVLRAKIEDGDGANNSEKDWNKEIVTDPSELHDQDNGCKWHLHRGC